MPIYPGDPKVSLETVRRAIGTATALSQLHLGSHTGTHIDAPLHINDHGKGTASYTLDQLNGEVVVYDYTHVSQVISARDLPRKLPTRIIFKTKNSQAPIDTFDPSFVALDESAASILAQKKVTLVGTDGPSIKKKGVKDQTHQILLNTGVIILEGLWLPHVTAGTYNLVCMPLPIDADGAPVRAALFSP